MNKNSNEKFLEKIKNLLSEYSINSIYKNSKTKISITHLTCGKTFEMRPDNFIAGQRCPYCARKNLSEKKKSSTENFKKKVKKLEGENYSVLGEYKKSNIKILIRHNCDECNFNEFLITPNNFLNGSRCPKCAQKKRIENRTGKTSRRNISELRSIVQAIDNDYIVISKNYINNKSKLIFFHKSCGKTFEMRPDNFIAGQRCPYCAKLKNDARLRERSLKYIDVKKYIEASGEYLLVSSEYKNSSTPIEITHKGCGTTFNMRLSDFKSGERCPHCYKNKSKGEDVIRKFLEDHNYSFKEQFSFCDCKYKRVLPFDFAVFKDNNIFFLIEFDGEDHFRIVNRSTDQSKNAIEFENRKIRDKIKDNYCKSNNIPILRISYLEKDNYKNLLITFINKISTTIENTSNDGNE